MSMTEQEIINAAYSLLEQDSTLWATTDDEYTTARAYLNTGINRWEHFDNTPWRELWTMNSSAASSLGGDTSTSASVSDYDCPSNMAYPGGYVTTGSGTSKTFWTVIAPEKFGLYRNSENYVCYFTGNKEAGFDLHFNPNITMTAGSTIDYPYYKKASTTDAASGVVEMSDPYFLSYYIASHMGEDGINEDFFTMAEARLDQMRTRNMSGYFGVPDNIDDSGDGFIGFGEQGLRQVSSDNPTAR